MNHIVGSIVIYGSFQSLSKTLLLKLWSNLVIGPVMPELSPYTDHKSIFLCPHSFASSFHSFSSAHKRSQRAE